MGREASRWTSRRGFGGRGVGSLACTVAVIAAPRSLYPLDSSRSPFKFSQLLSCSPRRPLKLFNPPSSCYTRRYRIESGSFSCDSPPQAPTLPRSQAPKPRSSFGPSSATLDASKAVHPVHTPPPRALASLDTLPRTSQSDVLRASIPVR